MKQTKRPSSEKPYPARVWLAKPVKTTLIFGGIITGLVWLSGALIDNLLPAVVTFAAAVACVDLFAVYFIIAITSTHKREHFAQQCRDIRKQKIAEFEAAGFTPTRKFIGSSRIFAVDEKMGEWYLIDYFNGPDKARLHDISSITQAMAAKNGDQLPSGYKALLPNGELLSKKDNDLYYSKMGVLLQLNEPDCPTVFINCFKTENDVELILAYLIPQMEASRNEDAG